MNNKKDDSTDLNLEKTKIKIEYSRKYINVWMDKCVKYNNFNNENLRKFEITSCSFLI